MATTFAWQEDAESKFMDFKAVAKDSGGDCRVVRLRVRQAEAEAGGSLITFESESDISDLQPFLREFAMNTASETMKSADGGIHEFVEEDRGVTFRGIKVMSYVPAPSTLNPTTRSN
jgi:hypothetical protein